MALRGLVDFSPFCESMAFPIHMASYFVATDDAVADAVDDVAFRCVCVCVRDNYRMKRWRVQVGGAAIVP